MRVETLELDPPVDASIVGEAGKPAEVESTSGVWRVDFATWVAPFRPNRSEHPYMNDGT